QDGTAGDGGRVLDNLAVVALQQYASCREVPEDPVRRPILTQESRARLRLLERYDVYGMTQIEEHDRRSRRRGRRRGGRGSRRRSGRRGRGRGGRRGRGRGGRGRRRSGRRGRGRGGRRGRRRGGRGRRRSGGRGARRRGGRVRAA